jgi:hypothetical protein
LGWGHVANETIITLKYTYYNPDNILTREKLRNVLVEKLNKIGPDDNFEDNIKKKISDCVSGLPMWYPMDTRKLNISRRHHQPINAPTAGAQAFLMDYT